jgi:hypothetical protein
VPGLPLRAPPGTPVNVRVRPIVGRLGGVFERDLIEQSVAERVVRALFLAVLLWLAIWWGLS